MEKKAFFKIHLKFTKLLNDLST